MDIYIQHNTFRLLAEKAILWINTNTLIVSDLHIGKVSHFRREGIAVPSKALTDNFNRLDHIIRQQPVQRIIFTGDLFHSSMNMEWEYFRQWRLQYPDIDMHIVMGNHDILNPESYDALTLRVHENTLAEGPFIFSHHPEPNLNGLYNIAGHIHPVVKLYGRANQALRLPCFYFGRGGAILPSFGYFTGGHAITAVPGDRIIALVNDRLMDVSSAV